MSLRLRPRLEAGTLTSVEGEWDGWDGGGADRPWGGSAMSDAAMLMNEMGQEEMGNWSGDEGFLGGHRLFQRNRNADGGPWQTLGPRTAGAEVGGGAQLVASRGASQSRDSGLRVAGFEGPHSPPACVQTVSDSPRCARGKTSRRISY